jgi:serine/threonine protein kinase
VLLPHTAQLCKSGSYAKFWELCLQQCPDFPLQAQDLLTKMFAANPAQRLTFAQVQQHPWLAGEQWPTDKVKVSSTAHLTKHAITVGSTVLLYDILYIHEHVLVQYILLLHMLLL